MDHMELVEKLMSKADVNMEEAKAVLERNGWDILDAMIELEKQGKIYQPHAGASTEGQKGEYRQVHATVSRDDCCAYSCDCDKQRRPRGSFGNSMRGFFDWVRTMIRKGIDNSVVVYNASGSEVLSIPVLFAALIMLCTFWFMIIIIIIALACGYRISFRGRDLGTEQINRGMDTVQGAAAEFASKMKTAGSEFMAAKDAAKNDAAANNGACSAQDEQNRN